MEIRIRELVVELLQNPYIDVTYNEVKNGGFELIVRVKDDINFLQKEEE